MKNTEKAFLKYNILNSLQGPSYYILTILFSVFLSGNYFIRQQFFSGNGSTDLLLFFSAVPYISIIAVPALCYRHSFAIYDDFIPLPSIKKIWLTFLSRFILYSIMILFLLPSALLVNLYGSIDWGQLFTGFICLFFYGAAVISVCTFIEKLINNRILSFVISAVILAIFNAAHLFAVYVSLPAVLVSLVKELSFAWHFDAAGKGIFDTRDILWLAGSTMLFIYLADFVTGKKAGRGYGKPKAFAFTARILLSLLIMLNGSRWYTRLDFSQNKTYSLSKFSKALLSTVQQPVKITYYQSSSIAKLYPQVRDVMDFLTEYASQNKNISLLVKDPDNDQSVKTMLENYGIQTQQMRTVTNTITQYVNVYSAIVIEYKGYVETIPFTMAANTLEYDLDGRLKHLITGVSRTVNIVIGNGLSLNEDYSYLVPWLNSQGFVCNPLYPEQAGFVETLRESEGLLLIIGDSQISIDNAIAIEDYILNRKGNAFFMVSPYSSAIEDDWSITANQRTNIVEMLENWGVTFTQKIVGDISNARITMYSDDQSETQIINYPLWVSLLQQTNSTNGITLFWPTALEVSGNAQPYLYTSPAAFAFETDKNSPKRLIETNPFVMNTVNTSSLEKGTFTVGAEINGELKGLYNLAHSDKSRIMVIPDQYFVNSLMTGYIGGQNGDYRNFEFLTTSLLKLNGEEELAELNSRGSRDSSLYKVTDSLSFVRYQLITYLILYVLIPLAILIFGVIYNVGKNRKNK